MANCAHCVVWNEILETKMVCGWNCTEMLNDTDVLHETEVLAVLCQSWSPENLSVMERGQSVCQLSCDKGTNDSLDNGQRTQGLEFLTLIVVVALIGVVELVAALIVVVVVVVSEALLTPKV